MVTWKHLAMGVALTAAHLAATGVAEADPVPVRAETSDGRGRLVFDWPQPVNYMTSLDVGSVTLTFDRPVDAALGAAVRALPDYLADGYVGPDSSSVTLALKPAVQLTSFRDGSAIVVELAHQASGMAPFGTSPRQPAPAASDEGRRTMIVRAGRHNGFSRVVFRTAEPLDYRVVRDGDVVTVGIDTRAIADLSIMEERRLPQILDMTQAPDADRLTVRISVPDDARIRHFRHSAGIVVDVMDPTSGPPAVRNDAGDGETAVAEAATGAAAGGSALTDAERRRAEEGLPLYRLKAPSRKPDDEPAAVRQATPNGQPVPTAKPDASVAADAASPEEPTSLVRPDDTGPLQEENASVAVASPEVAGETPGEAATASVTDDAPAGSALAAATQDPDAAQEDPVLVFDPGQPTSVAAFVRAGYLYVVLDRRVDGIRPQIREGASGVTGRVEPVDIAQASAYRMQVPIDARPVVERNGTEWRVRLPSEQEPAPSGLWVEPQPEFPLGPRLIVHTQDAATVIDMEDPEVGDRLRIIPLPVAGSAVTSSYKYTQLEILAAAQGVVVRPNGEGLSIRMVSDGIELTTAEGLYLSAANDREMSTPRSAIQATEPPLFDFDAWRQGPISAYTDLRQTLQRRIVDADPVERDRAHLDLARFYLAHGLGPEALGILQVVAERQPDFEVRPDFLSMRGAARLLSGDFAMALEDFGSPGISGGEAAIWRGVAAARLRDWDRARQEFSRGAEALDNYPEPFFSRFAPLAAEAALVGGDAEEATRIVERMGARSGGAALDRPAVLFLRGRIMKAFGSEDKAAEYWRRAMESNDRLYRARSALALTEMEREQGTITAAQAAERLDALRFAWRGDDIELTLLHRLGRLHIEAGDYKAGLSMLRQAVSVFPDHPRATEITEEMIATFTGLFVDDESASLSPLSAVALFEEFRELTPVGAAGDEVIRKLAERLVEIDLLERAASLLDHQVRFRLAGAEKAEVGARLAAIHLLDGKAGAALTAIEESAVPDAPPALQAERRLLQARALSELSRASEALDLLADDEGRNADLLRVDIAWRDRQWALAAQALDKVIGPPPAEGASLAPETANLILNRAVALGLAGDVEGLRQLRQTFGPVMAAGPDADAFTVLTRPDQATGLPDERTIRSRVAEVDVFKGFLANYREKLGGVAGTAVN